MPQFSADYSSSLPSTPGTGTLKKKRNPLLAGMPSQLSTTPAGPPPSSAASFTPADPPPSAVFGSSRLGTGVSKLRFGVSTEAMNEESPDDLRTAINSKARMKLGTKNGTPAKGLGSSRLSPAIRSSPAKQGHFSRSVERIMSGDVEEDDDEMIEDEPSLRGSLSQFSQPGSRPFTGATSVNIARAAAPPRSSLLGRGVLSSARKSQLSRSQRGGNGPRLSTLPRKGKQDIIPNIAKDLSTRSDAAPLHESDAMISETEDLITGLHEEVRGSTTADEVAAVMSDRVNELRTLWRASENSSNTATGSAGIGPGDGAPLLVKSEFLVSLLLPLHHPPAEESVTFNRFAASSSLQKAAPTPAPIPQILIDWLDKHHVTYGDLLRTVKSTRPNVTASELFWDTVQSLVLRGKLKEVARLFTEADFQYAATAVDDEEEEAGYSGARLQTVQSIIYRAKQVLDACPGTKDGNWHVDGSEWDLYRKRVTNELEYLTRLAEGNDGEDRNRFEAVNFGILKADKSLLDTSKYQSQVPWMIYQNLKVMYSVLLGGAVEIISQSMDWLEAAAALTIWWDGPREDTLATWSLNVSRSQRQEESTRTEDPYLARLCAAFLCVTDPDDKDSFMLNPQSILEVGMASVLQGNVEGVLGALRTYSLCIASAVAEIGSMGDWLDSGSSAQSNGLSQEDLMVLSYGAEPSGIKKDDILLTYAEALFQREELRAKDGTVVEGWELAISITARLDDRELAYNATSEFIRNLALTCQERMDKLVTLCINLGLEEEAQKVSEKYADHLINSGTQYGTALICYARSHSSSKTRLLIDLLVSYSLVSSAAYPPASEVDEHLRILIESPKKALSSLQKQDPEAADMLSFYLSGYACLRRFYDLRDEDILAKQAVRTSTISPIARKRAAAKALTAAINSAADSVYGGLYDSERQSAIQVDGLLTLLGEATALLARPGKDKPILTTDQMYALLAAIEDLQTVNSRVYDATEECLQAALRNYAGSVPPSPRDMLKKSVSSGTNSNFSFSMMGSEMLARSEEGGSGVLVGKASPAAVERGWDWRAGFKEKGTSGKDVLKALRLGIAKELSMAELDEGEPRY